MNTMPLFSELEKLGYKKHSEKSFEELDELPFDSKEITIEKSFVFKWFEEAEYKSMIEVINVLTNKL